MVNEGKYFLLFLLITLPGCNPDVTEGELIVGTWEVTSKYQGGEHEDESSCVLSAVNELKFENKVTVYFEGFESNFKYWLEDSGSEIHFAGDEFGLYLIYEIEEMSDNEIVLTSEKNRDSKVESCYLERQ